MSRLGVAAPTRPGAAPQAVSPTSARCHALNDTALATKREIDALIEQETARGRTIASFVAVAGLLAMLFGLAGAIGLGQAPVFMALAGISLLVPIGYALVQAGGGASRIATLAHERAWSQGLAFQAKRLAEAVGSTDGRGFPLGPEAIINGQIDGLFRELDRTKHRLVTSGIDAMAAAEHRPQDRIVPAFADTVLIPADGRRYPVRIVGLSPLGVVLRGTVPFLRQAQEVQIGSRQATVVAIGPREIALRFLAPNLPAEFNTRIVL